MRWPTAWVSTMSHSNSTTPLFPADRQPAPQIKLFAPDEDAPPSSTEGRLSTEMTLPDFWQEFFLPVRLTGADPKTLKEDRTTGSKWRNFAGDRPLAEIDRPLLAGFVPWLQEKGLGLVTATKHLNRVQTWLRAAGPDPGDGLCAELLAKVVRVKPPRCPVRLPDKAFSLAEIGSWLDAAHHAHALPRLSVPAAAWWQSLILFDYNCPLRFEALTAIRWEFLEERSGGWWLHVPAEADKKDTERVFYLSSHAVAALGQRQSCGLIFGLPLSPARIYSHARYLLDRSATVNPARQQQRVFHGLRAACDTELRKMGYPTAAKRALGHAIGRDVAAGFYTGEAEYVAGMERLPQPSFARFREPQLRLF
jgi:integrase